MSGQGILALIRNPAKCFELPMNNRLFPALRIRKARIRFAMKATKQDEFNKSDIRRIEKTMTVRYAYRVVCPDSHRGFSSDNRIHPFPQ
jgi:hypothetical protein